MTSLFSNWVKMPTIFNLNTDCASGLVLYSFAGGAPPSGAFPRPAPACCRLASAALSGLGPTRLALEDGKLESVISRGMVNRVKTEISLTWPAVRPLIPLS